MMTSGKITIAEALKQGVELLSKNKTIETPRLDAEVLLCYVLKCDRIYLVINKDKILTDTEKDTYLSYIRRRSINEPISYITGTKEFMSLNFDISKGVLIPRPDTEILVEKLIDIYKDKEATILDLCTGSGAIAISLAYYLKNVSVIAVDKFDACINCAKQNADKIGVSIEILKEDVLNDFKIDSSIDCIVSNPPYIESDVLSTLSRDVKDYEPEYALDGGNDGLIFYRKITEFAANKLKSSGILAYEIGYNQADAVKEILINTNCFDNIEILKDLSGNNRVVLAERI